MLLKDSHSYGLYNEIPVDAASIYLTKRKKREREKEKKNTTPLPPKSLKKN